ncbi:hypothetical protein CFI00_08495 [Nocardioides sp. S5]|uniref:hypothetical protein n=1 Tax=Nocardioides sp. S5 TaxID=2017486 RepID=UPI001A8FA927|nr:hypothetical protein [Nocardioides sp. S5]QSR30542.1 hypothetical protein CFI00_08495 [Nocardioides sp. S5]
MRRMILLATAAVLSASACSPTSPATPDPSAAPVSTAAEAGTDPGTQLDFGEPATLVWQPTADLTGELELSVESVVGPRASVFDGWLRDDTMAASRAYFLRVRLANTGESDLGGQAVPLYLRDDGGTLGAPWTLGGDFTACQSGPLPTPFAAGAEEEMCLVYLVPDRGRIRDVVFEPTEGYDPIVWTGDVEEQARPGARKKDAGKKVRDEQGRGG